MRALIARLLITLFTTGPGLIWLASLLSLIFISYAIKNIKERVIKDMTENLVALAFTTTLFTFFNILIKGKFIPFGEVAGEFILNAFLVLVIITIIKTTVDVINYTNRPIKRKKMR